MGRGCRMNMQRQLNYHTDSIIDNLSHKQKTKDIDNTKQVELNKEITQLIEKKNRNSKK